MAAAVEEISKCKTFGGWNRRYKHKSTSCGCDMIFQIFFPPQAEAGKVPVIYFLSGLTCTDENFMIKAGAQRKAAEYGIALIAPDTSPRGLNIPGESDSWDFGVAAGFYLNATVEKWKNWRMYEYITKELPSVLSSAFPNLDLGNAAISGHSMGGHGAITIALKNPTLYKSISAFAPICNPKNVPWGKKAFSGYLGDDESTWNEYDSVELMKTYEGPKLPLLVDTGSADGFLENQLAPDALEEACKAKKYPATFRMQEDYDHSYAFISTFIDDHFDHHASALGIR
ncbi:hypothetical protein BSKO_02971 [Bryopsis sp. KO-2023]|nr:hypothetical protein BSKO_02971 [Bryopsis sp. KO-2023]